jgi:hypothetical protein
MKEENRILAKYSMLNAGNEGLTGLLWGAVDKTHTNLSSSNWEKREKGKKEKGRKIMEEREWEKGKERKKKRKRKKE